VHQSNAKSLCGQRVLPLRGLGFEETYTLLPNLVSGTGDGSFALSHETKDVSTLRDSAGEGAQKQMALYLTSISEPAVGGLVKTMLLSVAL
jgi:hypothetical protein